MGNTRSKQHCNLGCLIKCIDHSHISAHHIYADNRTASSKCSEFSLTSNQPWPKIIAIMARLNLLFLVSYSVHTTAIHVFVIFVMLPGTGLILTNRLMSHFD